MFKFNELPECCRLTVDVSSYKDGDDVPIRDVPTCRVDVVSMVSGIDRTTRKSAWIEFECGSVVDVLEKSFLKERVFNKDFDFKSEGENVFYLTSTRKSSTWLTISMDVETYEKFGYRSGREDGERRLIRIQLDRKGFLESKKYERLLWCLARVPRLRCRLLCDEDTRKCLPKSFDKIEVRKNAVSIHKIDNVSILPDVEKIYSLLCSNSENKYEIAQNLQDWIGAVAHSLDDLVYKTGSSIPADGDTDAFVSKFRLFSSSSSLQFCSKREKATCCIQSSRITGYMNFTETSEMLRQEFDAASREEENSFRVFSCWYDSTLPSVWKRKGRAIPNTYMIPGQSASHTSIVILPKQRYIAFRMEPL